MHTVLCYVRLLDYCKQSCYTGIDLLELESLLKAQVNQLIDKHPDTWQNNYVCKPSFFIQNKDSIYYCDNKEICQQEV